ncbi:MAG: hypothetical protein LBW77_07460 [Verrucomicrobiota bacterium]|jgi:hypothetical protein|nr:hypothetical protein [Verrucomicrobiota bacterium]
MKKHLYILPLLAAAALCGCVSFFENPYFTVKESGLNWLSIRLYNSRTTPIQRVSVRIDGNGIVTVREGASPLVTNPFAANNADPHWNDIVESRVNLPPDETTRIFQMLVDQGLFKERRKGDSTNTNESIFASANIQGKTCGSEDDIFGSDSDLAEHLKSVVLMFYHPQPRRRR